MARQLCQNHHIVVADWAFPEIQLSRYVNAYYPITSPEINLDACILGILEVVASEKIEAILPITDAALEVMKASGNAFSGLEQWNVNEDSAYVYAHNKAHLIEVAGEVGILSPASVLISTLAELDSFVPAWSFPCILKPVSSAVRVGNSVYGFGVRVCKDVNQIQDFGREIILNTPFLIQEKVQGTGFGFNFFARNGEITASYVHERLSEYNGQSGYRRSHDAKTFPMYAKCVELVRKIGWNGVGMLEFKVDGSNYYLMELNGRFYGSSEVAIAAGLNFPRMLSGDLDERSAPTKYRDAFVINFREELFKGLDQCVKTKKPSDLLSLGGRLLKSLFLSDHFVEDNLFTDTRFQFELYRKSILGFLIKRRKKGRGVVIGDFIKPPNFLEGRANQKICFVCFGNICRSPFAEVLASRMFPQHRFSSSGFYPQQNRISPGFARKTALHFGVNLDRHQSSCMVESTPEVDYFIVFDELNLIQMLEKGVSAEKLIMLGPGIISDPYQKSEEEFQECYRKIEAGLNRLF